MVLSLQSFFVILKSFSHTIPVKSLWFWLPIMLCRCHVAIAPLMARLVYPSKFFRIVSMAKTNSSAAGCWVSGFWLLSHLDISGRRRVRVSFTNEDNMIDCVWRQAEDCSFWGFCPCVLLLEAGV